MAVLVKDTIIVALSLSALHKLCHSLLHGATFMTERHVLWCRQHTQPNLQCTGVSYYMSRFIISGATDGSTVLSDKACRSQKQQTMGSMATERAPALPFLNDAALHV